MAKKKSTIKILSEAKLRAKYHSNTATSVVEEDPLWLPSTILSLNAQLGGGIPYGKLLEIFGYQSTGKSLMASSFASACQKLGGKVLWIDAESAWTNYWARANDVDPSEVELLVDNRIEVISDWARDMCYFWRSQLTNNEPILLVIDSLAMLDTMDNEDKTMSDAKAEMGNRAKKIGDFWRVRQPMFYKLGVCVIAINQVRKKLGASMFEDPNTTPGGEATKFAASQRILLTRGKKVEDSKKRKLGQTVFVRIEKNKVAPPADSVKTEVYFRENDNPGYIGYNKYMGLHDLLLQEDVIDKKGTIIKFEDQTIARGEDSLIKLLHTNKKIRQAIVKASPINTISKTRSRLSEIDNNLYPVTTALEDEEE